MAYVAFLFAVDWSFNFDQLTRVCVLGTLYEVYKFWPCIEDFIFFDDPVPEVSSWIRISLFEFPELILLVEPVLPVAILLLPLPEELDPLFILPVLEPLLIVPPLLTSSTLKENDLVHPLYRIVC